MIAIVTVLLAFPLGYLLRSRTAACLGYVAAYGYAFSFQNVYLLRAWVGDPSTTFPKDPESLPVSYLAVTLAIYAIGFGLVTLGHRLGRSRRDRRSPTPGAVPVG